MSVRRLADETVQPPAFAFTNDNAAWAEKKIREYPAGRQQSAVIPLLFRAQEQEGWISRPAIETVAQMLSMPYIRVLEVATFYTQFQLKPVGSRAHIQVCGTTPCMLRGAEDIRAVCEHRISHEPFTISDDGTLSWEEVECLGACVNAPMIAIGSDTYEDLTPARMEEIVEAFRSGRGDTIKPGTQIPRENSAAEGGRTTLTEPPTATREKFVPPAPPEAPAAAAAPAAPAAPAPAAPQAPTTPGRKSQVPEEAAPAVKGPPDAPKVSEAVAEAERAKANASRKADGEPNDAMREGATGAESPAGKIDAGAKTGDAGDAAPLFEAPAGARDDLKFISGVGPKLEARMNALGITTWRQVAALGEDDIRRIEARLSFAGRITRDRWIDQARALAEGGVEEYRRVFGKDPR